MSEMIKLFASWFPDRKIIHVVHGAYANNVVIMDLPENVEIVSRIRRDAAIVTTHPIVKYEREHELHECPNVTNKIKYQR